MGRYRTKTADRNKIIGFLFLALLVFSLVFCLEPPNATSLGDILLKKIGLSAWEYEYGGFHYTFLYALIMFIIGIMGTIDFLQEFYPRFIKRLPLILIVFLLLYPSIYSYADKTVKSFSNGVNAVSYNRETSNAECTVDTEGNFIINADLQFHNYSGKEVSFFIKIIPDKQFLGNFISTDPITAADPEIGKPKKFTIKSKTTGDLQVTFKSPLKTELTNFQGSMSSLNIIIFTEEKEKKFVKEY